MVFNEGGKLSEVRILGSNDNLENHILTGNAPAIHYKLIYKTVSGMNYLTYFEILHKSKSLVKAQDFCIFVNTQK